MWKINKKKNLNNNFTEALDSQVLLEISRPRVCFPLAVMYREGERNLF
jgi:hypothetical protein